MLNKLIEINKNKSAIAINTKYDFQLKGFQIRCLKKLISYIVYKSHTNMKTQKYLRKRIESYTKYM